MPKITLKTGNSIKFNNRNNSQDSTTITQNYGSTITGTAVECPYYSNVYAFAALTVKNTISGTTTTRTGWLIIRFDDNGIPLAIQQAIVVGNYTPTYTTFAGAGVYTWSSAGTDTYSSTMYARTVYNSSDVAYASTGITISCTPSYKVTLDNTEGFATATLKAGSTSYSVAAGSSYSVSVDKNTYCTFSVSSTDNEQGHYLGWEKDGSTVTTSTSYGITVSSGAVTLKALWTPKYAVSIVAPSNSSIDYVFGLDGSAIDDASGTVAAGQSVTVRVYNTSVNGKMTLVLSIPDANYSTDTFQGWTKDGAVIDRWSNPATIVASEAATYSCAIGSAPSPSPDVGMLLYDRYGNLLYAGDPSTVTHTISVTATFAVTQHWIDYDIAGTSGDVEVTGTTFSKSVSFSDSRFGNSTGELLYADKVLAAKPFLTKVFFHCQVPEHMYSVVIKLDGTQIYSEDYLSGTFSKTFEI